MANGQTRVDIAHRLGIWISVLVIGGYVLNLGHWAGAVEEQLKDAETVEETQKALLIQVATIAAVQLTQTVAITDNKDAIEASRRDILNAIKEAND
ncbi:hypothetical protein LCGC14_1815830 [marine sediment metagenome]|uniref:Uncharacterized protein n=1 Tax=marine sediment metagenome TaxID=412755 RepID=A0A0F9H8J4_9ZZZZ